MIYQGGRHAQLWHVFSLCHSGNKGGSYITIMSLGGLEFGILNIIGSFGNVWCAL